MKIIKHDTVIELTTAEITKAILNYLELNNRYNDKDSAKIEFNILDEDKVDGATVTVTTK